MANADSHFKDDSTQTYKMISRIEYKHMRQNFKGPQIFTTQHTHTHTISCFVCLFVWP